MQIAFLALFLLRARPPEPPGYRGMGFGPCPHLPEPAAPLQMPKATIRPSRQGASISGNTGTTPAWMLSQSIRPSRHETTPAGPPKMPSQSIRPSRHETASRLLLPAAHARCLMAQLKQTWPAPGHQGIESVVAFFDGLAHAAHQGTNT